jgi:D-aminopeptidase
MTTPLSGQLPAEPVFAGAISSEPTSMTESTLTGELEFFTFTASEAGEYRLVCYVPGHALAGMWVRFVVGDETTVTGAPNVPISIN